MTVEVNMSVSHVGWSCSSLKMPLKLLLLLLIRYDTGIHLLSLQTCDWWHMASCGVGQIVNIYST